jgi:sugar lactone lactonase YvrE
MMIPRDRVNIVRRGLVFSAVMAAAGLLLVAPASSATKSSHVSAKAAAAIRLKQPTGLAVASDGLLFIADQSLNEVLVRFPNGSLRVIAGTGHAGFSGDGGLATAANLSQPGALVLSTSGNIFVADVGNHRVRELLPNNLITTFAGNGGTTTSVFKVGEKATQVAMPPSGLALAPGGRLYVASGNDVVELSASGIIVQVIPVKPTVTAPLRYPDALCDPDALAVSPQGQLYIGCGNSRVLFERQADGILKVVNNTYRPHDFAGLAFTKGGALLMDNHETLFGVVGGESVQLIGPGTFGALENFVPSGVAVAPNGTIYVDAQSGDGIGGAGLAKITAGGADVMLRYWKGN